MCSNLNRINIEERAPWMKVAIQEAKKSAGCHEGKEPANFYDYFIHEQPAEYRGGMDELKQGELDAIDGQVEKLMFWNEASGKIYERQSSSADESGTTDTSSDRDFRGGITEDPRWMH